MTPRQRYKRRQLFIIALFAAIIIFCIATEPTHAEQLPQPATTNEPTSECSELVGEEEYLPIPCTPELLNEIEDLIIAAELQDMAEHPEILSEEEQPTQPQQQIGEPYIAHSTPPIFRQPKRQAHPHRLRRGCKQKPHHQGSASVLGARHTHRRTQSQLRRHRPRACKLGATHHPHGK